MASTQIAACSVSHADCSQVQSETEFPTFHQGALEWALGLDYRSCVSCAEALDLELGSEQFHY